MLNNRFSVARGSLAVNFTIGLVLIFFVLQLPLWMIFLYSQRNDYHSLLRERIRTSSDYLGVSAKTLLLGTDSIVDFQQHVDSVVKDKEVLSIRLTDASGQVLLNVVSGQEERGKSINPFYIPWKNSLKKDIKTGETVAGTLEIIYSGSVVNASMFRLLIIPPIGQVIFAVFMVIAVFLFLHRKLGEPVQILTERIEKIIEGDFTVEMPDMSGNELASIADGLDYLVKKLATTLGRINWVADTVSGTIMGLNASFDNVVDMVKKQSASTDEIALSVKNASDAQKHITENADTLARFSTENLSSLMEVRASEDEIYDSMGNLFESTEQSYRILEDMVQNSKLMSDNVEDVMSSVENTSASVEEIIASVREVENSAHESSMIAERVREQAAHHGVVIVDHAIHGMRKISEKVKYSVEIVNRLGARSKDVQGILLVMKEVTEQTNLLSVNASILAEQAGEFGKGFSVVASEMRALGAKAEGHTKDIAGIIKTTQKEIAEVVQSIEQGMILVDEGVETVYKVGESMSEILEASHDSAQMTKMIERATNDQVLALRHIEQSVVEVNMTTQEMSEVTEKHHRSSGYILSRIGETKDVSHMAHKGTGEQVVAVAQVSKNLERANDRIASINEAIGSQQKHSEGIVMEIDEIKNSGVWILTHMEQVSHSLNQLMEELGTLKKEADIFKVE
ncbi:methyl-accepting chemotaxis protein [Nitrospirota bacterium]